jgi:RES domain-containing protein
MPVVWRLTKTKYAASALSGYGSVLHGGRWHARGRPVVYCASSAALALLETLVHVERPDLLRFAYVALPVTVPEGLIERLADEALPADWRAWPHPASTQVLGSRWFDEQRSVALDVPSAVVPHERNVLINPLHPAFREVEVGEPRPFPVDPRLAG